MRSTTDFLVIGSGIAGLTFALKVAEYGSVTVITKASPEESNTKYAQGGIAGVLADSDSFESHIADTLEAGAGRCDERIVRMVVSEAPDRIHEMIAWGARFDRKSDGTFDLAKEGGIPPTGSFITKTARAMRWNVRCWRRSVQILASSSMTIILRLT